MAVIVTGFPAAPPFGFFFALRSLTMTVCFLDFADSLDFMWVLFFVYRSGSLTCLLRTPKVTRRLTGKSASVEIDLVTEDTEFRARAHRAVAFSPQCSRSDLGDLCDKQPPIEDSDLTGGRRESGVPDRLIALLPLRSPVKPNFGDSVHVSYRVWVGKRSAPRTDRAGTVAR